jgi:Uri superfamily endonuclease
MSLDALRSAPGTYALVLRAEARATLAVGRLGTLGVAPGAYVYAGSALGPGGVAARVRRHARADGARHWHVDYLRRATTLDAAWVTYDAARRECAWATALRALPGATLPLAGFGASDCACPAHLVRFPAAPPLAAFRAALDAAHPPVERVPVGA